MLVDLEFKYHPRERLRRAASARIRPAWHRDQATSADAAADWYAAAFHRAWVLKADPTLSNTDDIEQFNSAYVKLATEYGGGGKDLDPYLAPVVKEMREATAQEQR